MPGTGWPGPADPGESRVPIPPSPLRCQGSSHASAARRPAVLPLVHSLLVLLSVLVVLLAPGALAARATTAASAPPLHQQRLDQQAEETLPIMVELDAVDPAVLGPGVPFAVRGSVHNVSTSPVPVSEVQAETAYRSLDTRVALEAWSTGDAGVSTSRVIGRDTLGGGVLAPGDSRSFWLRMDGERLSPPFDFATLPLAVKVLGDGSVRGRVHSYLPWYAGEPADPALHLSWVVPLTKPAEPQLFDADPDVRDTAWLRAIGEGSRAQVWLDGLSGGDSAPTFLVDPTLLAPLPPVGEVTDPVPAPLPTPIAPEDPAPDQPTEGPTAPSTDPPPTGGSQTATPEQATQPGREPSSPAPSSPPVSSADPTGPAPSSPDPTDPAPPTLPGVELPEVLTEVEQAQVDVQTRLSGLEPNQVWWLPAGDPDVAALLDLQAPPSLIEQLIPGEVPESPLVAGRLVDLGRHDIAWPAWSRVGQDDLAALARGWPQEETPLSAVLVPDTAVQAVDSTGTTGGAVRVSSGADDLTLLAFDTTLSGLLAAAPPPQRDGAVIQRLLAETMAIYQQAPAQQRGVVLGPPRQTVIDPRTLSDLTAALDQAPWLTQVSAAEALADPEPARLTGTPLERPATGDRTAYPVPADTPLTEARLGDIEALRSTLLEISGILPSDQAVQRWQPVIDGTYSTRWRSDPESWSTPLTELQSQVEQVQAGLRVNPTTVNFLAEEALIQMTVVNTLSTDVQDVVLHVEPANGRLLVVEPPEPISIGAQSRATVQFRARAVAAGEVPVRVYLSTPSGLKLGETQELTVRVRPAGEWIYWVLGGVAGVILILGLARAGRRPSTAAGGSTGGRGGGS